MGKVPRVTDPQKGYHTRVEIRKGARRGAGGKHTADRETVGQDQNDVGPVRSDRRPGRCWAAYRAFPRAPPKLIVTAALHCPTVVAF